MKAATESTSAASLAASPFGVPSVTPRAAVDGWAARSASILFFAASIYGLGLYPFAQSELAAGLIAYAAAILWRPALTLLLLPVLLTLLNLAPWSGSLLLEEFDLFVLANIGALLARRQYTLDIPLGRMQRTFLLLLILSYAASLTKGLLRIPEIDFNAAFGYDSPINVLRVAKGFFWPLLLLPGLTALWQRDRRQAARYLSWGFALSALAIGVVAMWERGVFFALAESGSPYASLSALLDFTTRYRITGLFSEMHVGGEYIDGFIALAWPFGVALALHARRSLPRIVGVVSHLAILYAAVTTFSRATYLAAGAGAAILSILLLRGWLARAAAQGRSAELMTIALNAGVLLAAGLAFTRGGAVSLYVGLMAWMVAVYMGHATWRRWPLARKSSILLVALSAILMAYGMAASRWVDNSIQYSLLMAATLAATLVVSGVRLGRRLDTMIDRRTLATVLALVAGSLAIVTPAILGYRMEARFAASAGDVSTRVQHWRIALALMTRDLPTTLVGMGLGQFPHEFIKNEVSAKAGSYSIGAENGNRHLTLIEGEHFRFTQRISLPAHSDQTLALKLRSVADSYKLRLRLCRRHFIPAREKDPSCVVYDRDLQDTGGKWQSLQWQFNTGALGDNGVFGRHPLTLEITNLSDCNRRFMPTSIVDVDDVALTGSARTNTVRNGDFTSGADGWFPHSDWSHMRWHVKNTWANIYFDQGLIGLAGFGGFALVLLAGSIRRAWRCKTWSKNPLAVAGLLSLTSFLVLSPLGSPLDAPRLALIAYLLLFSLALDLAAKDERRHAPEAQ